jgi:ankyrin repeat protein
MVELLLSYGADPNDGLTTAAEAGHGEVIRLLVAKGVQPTTLGLALIEAAQRGDVEIVNQLLAAGADPNARRSFDQKTPLLVASEWGNLACVERLLAAGANLEAVDYHGKNTSLILAAKGGHLAVVKKLVEAGAQVDRQNDTGYAALDKAMDGEDEKHRAVVRYLWSRGAAGKGYVLGIRTPRFLWDVGVLAFAAAYLGTAVYLQEKTYHGRTEDNPFRWVSFGLLVGTGTTLALLASRPYKGNDPMGAVGLGRAMVLIVAGVSTVAYGVPALIFRNNRYAYYASAGMVATLPLLSLRF